jgi:hypothetical protein
MTAAPRALCTRCGGNIGEEPIFSMAKPADDELLPAPRGIREAAERGYQMEAVCPACWAKRPEPTTLARR